MISWVGVWCGTNCELPTTNNPVAFSVATFEGHTKWVLSRWVALGLPFFMAKWKKGSSPETPFFVMWVTIWKRLRSIHRFTPLPTMVSGTGGSHWLIHDLLTVSATQSHSCYEVLLREVGISYADFCWGNSPTASMYHKIQHRLGHSSWVFWGMLCAWGLYSTTRTIIIGACTSLTSYVLTLSWNYRAAEQGKCAASDKQTTGWCLFS